MTTEQKKKVLELRSMGLTTAEIAAVVGASANTVKTYCYRNKDKLIKETPPASVHKPGHCLNCGAIITQTPKQKPKKFCQVRCREIWWNRNRKQFNSNMRTANCAYCGQKFEKFERSPQRYCSHNCYINHRFGEVNSRDAKQRAVSK